MGFCSDVTELDEMNRIREEMINRLPTATEKVNNIDRQNRLFYGRNDSHATSQDICRIFHEISKG